MPNGTQVEQLLRTLLNALTGGMRGGGAGSLPSGGNLAYSSRIQPGILSALLGGVFPAFAPKAPPTFLAAHFEEMQKRQGWRSRVSDYYQGYSPTAIKALQKLGVKKSQLVDESTGQMTSFGRAASFAYNSTFGRMLGNRANFSANASGLMRDLYQGQFIGGQGAGQGFGLSAQEIRRQVANLHGLGSRGPSGLFKRGAFGPRDMFEVQRLGVQRGMMVGGSVGDMTTRTAALANTIKTGMAVFHTLSKERVLENLQRMTQGTVSLANPGQLNAMLMRVSGLAKTANMSIQAMTRIATEGGALYKQVGITGTGGATAHMQTFMAARLATSAMGGRAPMISAGTVARAGGLNTVTALMQRQTVGFVGSQYFQNAAFFAQQGDKAALAAVNKGGAYTSGDVARGVNKLAARLKAKDPTLDDYTARLAAHDMLVTGRNRAASDVLANSQAMGKGFDLQVAQENAQYKAMVADVGTPEYRAILERSGKNAQDKAIQMAYLTRHFMNAGSTEQEAKVLAEKRWGFVKGDKKDIDARRKIYQQQQLTNAYTAAREKLRPSSTAAGRLYRKFKASGMSTTTRDIFSAIFSGNSDIQKYLEKGASSASGLNDLMQHLKPTDLYMNEGLFQTQEQKHVRGVLVGMSGNSLMNFETALGEGGMLDTVTAAIHKRVDYDDESLKKKLEKNGFTVGKTLALQRDDAERFFRNRDVNLSTMQQFVEQQTPMTAKQARQYLGRSDNVAAIMKLVETSGAKGQAGIMGLVSGVSSLGLKANASVVSSLRERLASDKYKDAKSLVKDIMSGKIDPNSKDPAVKKKFAKGGVYAGLMEYLKLNPSDIKTQAELGKELQKGLKMRLHEIDAMKTENIEDASDKLTADITDVYRAIDKPSAKQKELQDSFFTHIFGKDKQKEHAQDLLNHLKHGGPKEVLKFLRTTMEKKKPGSFNIEQFSSSRFGGLLRESLEKTGAGNVSKAFKEMKITVGGKEQKIGDLIKASQQQHGGIESLIEVVQDFFKWLKGEFNSQKNKPKTTVHSSESKGPKS